MAVKRYLIYKNHDIKNRSKYVYLYLCDRVNRDGICWPSIATIAKELELSKSTVRRALNDLRAAGLLTTKQRYRSNGGTSTLEYQLIMEEMPNENEF